jgi:1,4-alpha-glucan branching enzyme
VIDKHPGRDSQAIVVFRLPPMVRADRVCVVGDFNGWSTSAHPMRQGPEGFVAEISMETDRVHRFRYLLDGERWANDWAADDYVPNDFGGDDSVIDLRARATRVSDDFSLPRQS